QELQGQKRNRGRSQEIHRRSERHAEGSSRGPLQQDALAVDRRVGARRRALRPAGGLLPDERDDSTRIPSEDQDELTAAQRGAGFRSDPPPNNSLRSRAIV